MHHEKISETPNAGMLKQILILSYLGFLYRPSDLLGFKKKHGKHHRCFLPLHPLGQFRTNILAFTGGGKNPRFQPQNVPRWQQAGWVLFQQIDDWWWNTGLVCLMLPFYLLVFLLVGDRHWNWWIIFGQMNSKRLLHFDRPDEPYEWYCWWTCYFPAKPVL